MPEEGDSILRSQPFCDPTTRLNPRQLQCWVGFCEEPGQNGAQLPTTTKAQLYDAVPKVGNLAAAQSSPRRAQTSFLRTMCRLTPSSKVGVASDGDSCGEPHWHVVFGVAPKTSSSKLFPADLLKMEGDEESGGAPEPTRGRALPNLVSEFGLTKTEPCNKDRTRSREGEGRIMGRSLAGRFTER
ncbi:MAG TPA: hypothetical protein DCE44_18910 [Verrucomicrobiales bacterium]|nr:hypothetical protein [Verrucomicrobiales bacterium]